jgi:hypothetical protein
MTGNKLYEANHLCMMKLALIKEKNYKKTTTSKYHSSIVKTTSHIKNTEKVRNFAARWCSMRKYLILSKANNQGKQCKIQQQNAKYTARLQSNKREFKPIESKPLLFSFLLKNETNTTDYAIRAAKRTGNALGNFMKLSSLPDEST